MKTKAKGRPQEQPDRPPKVQDSRPLSNPVRTVQPPKLVTVDTAAPDTPAPRPLPATVRYGLMGLLTILILLPAFYYYRVVFNNAVNVPFEDDFDSALAFMLNYLDKTPSFTGKIGRIFSQHNEHRIVLDRLAFLTDYILSGHVNFRHLILFGNLSLAGVLFLLYRASFRNLPTLTKLAYFVPVSVLLFQLHYWELTVWGMASIQNLYIVVFALLSFYALAQSGKSAWFGIAIAGAVAATFTSGNGMFVFIIGLLVLGVQKDYRKLGIWVAVGLLTVGLYFWGYTKPAHHPPLLGTLLSTPGQFFDYFFTLTGSDFIAKPTWPAAAGKWMLVLAIGLVGWNALKNRLATNLTILALLAFMYLTCLSVTMARSGFGIQQALSPRYGILPVMLLIALYILTIETIQQRVTRPILGIAGLLIAVYLCQYSYRLNLPKVEDRTALLQYSSALYNDNKNNLILYREGNDDAKIIFPASLKRGIYAVPAITLGDLRSKPVQFDASRLTDTNDVTTQVQPFPTKDYLIIYQAWAVMNGIDSESTVIEVVAQSAQGTYAFATRRHIRYDVVNQLQSMQYLHAGFSCVIRKTDLKPGQYTLWLHLTNKNAESYFPLPGILPL